MHKWPPRPVGGGRSGLAPGTENMMRQNIQRLNVHIRGDWLTAQRHFTKLSSGVDGCLGLGVTLLNDLSDLQIELRM